MIPQVLNVTDGQRDRRTGGLADSQPTFRSNTAVCVASRGKNRSGLQLNKNAQLSLTNPRDAKPRQKLLQFDMKTSCSLLANKLTTCVK